MKNRFSFVALGQGGGNIGYLLEKRGYPVLYINTSQEDLDTLENAKFKYHIPEGEGCHKNRHKAFQLTTSRRGRHQYFTYFMQNFDPISYIFHKNHFK